jgi:GAF domain-containing protein
MIYPIATDEPERLNTLRNLHILDTGAEIPFDALTKIARIHFSIPIVAISLVDEERQWFKSHPGLGACQTNREVAFCNYTILSDDIFEVTDASENPTFKGNPLVTSDPNIRYYCGAPILVHGFRIGAFCIIDITPRQAMSSEDRDLLKELAYLTSHIILSHRMLRESSASLVAMIK